MAETIPAEAGGNVIVRAAVPAEAGGNFVVRAAVPADAGAMAEIYGYYVDNTAVSFEYASPDDTEFRRRLAEKTAEYPWLAAELDGRVVGYAYAGKYYGREAYRHSAELSVYVDRAMRGRGIGRALYAEIERLLRLQNVYRVYACIAVGTAGAGADEHIDDASVRFHERLGYRKIGEFRHSGWKFGRWYDTIWMEKELGEPLNAADVKAFIPFGALTAGE